MPKQKSRRAACKRFKATQSGLIKRGSQNRRHILAKKSTKRKRQLRKGGVVSNQELKTVKTMIQA